jgi:autoinducer 2-degrading protein
MYALTIVLTALPGREQELIDACLASVAPSRAEPGNLFFDLLVSEDRREVVFYEAYADEAAFAAHMAAPHTKRWQETALPAIDRSTIRFPAHRSIATAP